MTPDERLAEIQGELRSRNPENRIDPTLTRIEAVCGLLGDPQTAVPVIHVAGTNGKTTTSRMIETLLREFGLRTGLMTSPHLHDERERIRLDGEPVDVERYIEAWDDIAPIVGLVDEREGRLSYFEALTVLGFAIFADAPVDVAIIEVGLGGEFDASNVVQPVVTVITPIGLDHQDYLGPDLASIARAKAGILKPDAVPVIARQQLVAAEVIAKRCVELGLPMLREGLEFGVLDRQLAVGGQMLTIQGLAGPYAEIVLPLHGEHQASNAAVALAAVEAFFGGVGHLDDEVVRSAFSNVSSPGRCEVVRRSPTVIVDAAHNPHGAAALARTLEEEFDFAHITGVVSILADKDVAGVLGTLEPVFDEVVVTRNSSPRAAELPDITMIAVEVFGEDRVQVAGTLAEAADLAMELADRYGEGSGVVITGSVVTAAEARALFGRATA